MQPRSPLLLKKMFIRVEALVPPHQGTLSYSSGAKPLHFFRRGAGQFDSERARRQQIPSVIHLDSHYKDAAINARASEFNTTAKKPPTQTCEILSD